MNKEEKQNIKIGTKVFIRMDHGHLVEFIVKYAPWQLPHGMWVIGLEDMPGCYNLDRVEAIIQE